VASDTSPGSTIHERSGYLEALDHELGNTLEFGNGGAPEQHQHAAGRGGVVELRREHPGGADLAARIEADLNPAAAARAAGRSALLGVLGGTRSMSLTATGEPHVRRSAHQTDPIPPRPINDTRRYLSARM
jgi:hypothetical protein